MEGNITKFADDFKKIENEISKAIIGQKEIIKYVLISIICGGNVLLEGLPGLGKTQLIKTLGKVLELDFSRIQFTPDLMPSDITGTDIFVKNLDGSSGFRFQKGPVFSNLVLADEINRATPKTQSSLLEAMQERTVTVGGNTYGLPNPFFVLATQNPIELEGTYPLPEAQLDRFLLKLNVEFPSSEELLQIVNLTTENSTADIKKVCGIERLIEMGMVARQVPIASAVAEYAMKLIISTHPELTASPDITKKYIRHGASPRGAQAIVNVAKVRALLNGRFNVAYEDIKEVAYPVLRHRIILNFEALSDDITADKIISQLLEAK